MKLTKQIRLIPILVFLMLLFTVACSSTAQTESTTTEPVAISIPTPTGEAIAYGASLDEWIDVSDGNTAPTENTNGDELPPPEISTEVASTNTSQATDATDTANTVSTVVEYTLSDVTYQEILWDALVPEEFTSAAIMAKYEDKLAEFEDGSPEAFDLYTQMQEEFDNAPINETLNETFVRIPGFIAPLDYSDELITEFLLVPYFGACIHVPPPPANQTILVTTNEEYGIKPEDSYNPVWILGRLATDGATTELAEAGYVIQDAIIEPYYDDTTN